MIKRELSLGEEFLKKKVKVRGEGKGIYIVNDRSNPSLRTVFPFPRRRIPIKIIKNDENTTTAKPPFLSRRIGFPFLRRRIMIIQPPFVLL